MQILSRNSTLILFFVLLQCLFSFSVEAQNDPIPEDEEEQEKLIIFIQNTKESSFTISEILKLERFANDIGLPIKVVNIEVNGAPEEVKYTPFIVYQNYLGRKIYKGRYTTFRRLKNFINTVEFMPSDAGEYTVSNALVWSEGRSDFFVQSKITPLAGTIPEDFNPAVFMNEAWAGIKKGMKDFEFYSHKNFLLANEIFYLNYYPYAGDDGKFYVSYELYSHYDCVTPVYTQIDVPVQTNMYSVKKAFYLASKNLKAELFRQWKDSKLGDAISSISEEIKTVSWEQLSFRIPPPPSAEQKNKIRKEVFKFTKQWNYAGAYSKDKPALQFYFPPPIHQYSGVVPEIKGSILFEHQDSFLVSSMAGDFTVETPSLTMGLEDLDSAVHHKMIFIKEFPEASFKITSIRARKGAVIEIGKPTYTQVEADFSFMGKTLKVKAPTQFEPYLDDNGKLFLHVQSSFKIESLMENYSIEGPPGPPKSSNNVIIKIDLLLEPAAINN